MGPGAQSPGWMLQAWASCPPGPLQDGDLLPAPLPTEGTPGRRVAFMACAWGPHSAACQPGELPLAFSDGQIGSCLGLCCRGQVVQPP